jgi:hypothetical protein
MQNADEPWTLELSDTNDHQPVHALCMVPKDPQLKFGSTLTVSGEVHQGVLINPCKIERVE